MRASGEIETRIHQSDAGFNAAAYSVTLSAQWLAAARADSSVTAASSASSNFG
jgi:hypothetical protein